MVLVISALQFRAFCCIGNVDPYPSDFRMSDMFCCRLMFLVGRVGICNNDVMILSITLSLCFSISMPTSPIIDLHVRTPSIQNAFVYGDSTKFKVFSKFFIFDSSDMGYQEILNAIERHKY